MITLKFDGSYWAHNDLPDKVLKDSMLAIARNADHMTKEQKKIARTQMLTGLSPDGYSQLCDRKSSGNFQG